MKKLFSFTLAILITTISFAQSRIQSKTSSINPSTTPTAISFGVKAGLSSNGIRGEAAGNFQDLINLTNGAITTNNVMGFYAGGFLTIPVAEGISFEPGAYYSEKGYEMVGELNIKGLGFLGAGGKATLKTEYIDVPVLLKANLGGGLHIFAGPQFSFLSKANLHSSAGLLGIDLLSNDMDVTSKFNKMDVAATGGIGYTFGKGITLSASYDYGLSKIDANQNTKAYNQGFKIGLGISL